MSGDKALRVRVPRDPLATHLASPNRSSYGTLDGVLGRVPCADRCASILLCDLDRLAALALTSRRGSAFIRRAPFSRPFAVPCKKDEPLAGLNRIKQLSKSKKIILDLKL